MFFCKTLSSRKFVLWNFQQDFHKRIFSFHFKFLMEKSLNSALFRRWNENFKFHFQENKTLIINKRFVRFFKCSFTFIISSGFLFSWWWKFVHFHVFIFITCLIELLLFKQLFTMEINAEWTSEQERKNDYFFIHF